MNPTAVTSHVLATTYLMHLLKRGNGGGESNNRIKIITNNSQSLPELSTSGTMDNEWLTDIDVVREGGGNGVS